MAGLGGEGWQAVGDEAGQVNKVYMTEGLRCLPEGIGVYPEVIWAVKWE